MTDSSLVYTTNFEVGTSGPQNFIAKLKDIFDPAETTRDHYWELDNSAAVEDVNNNVLYVLLKAKQQTWATNQTPADWGLEDPNDQQILIEATVTPSQAVYVTYFPKGGVTNGNYQTIFVAGTTPVLNSGRCSVMYAEEYDLDYSPTAGNWFSGQFWIAEHRDINVLHPFSSLTLMFNTGQYQSAGGGNNGQSWSTGFHVGRIVSPINWNDPNDASLNAVGIDTYHASPGAPLITGDGVIVGVPDMWVYNLISNTNYWFKSSADAKSVIRTGDVWQTPDWDYKGVYSFDLPEEILSDANSWQRLIPLGCKLAFNTKRIGYTKYIRFYKGVFNFTPTVISAKHNSNQAWVGWRNHLYDYTGTGNFGGSRLCLLWNKNYTIVP